MEYYLVRTKRRTVSISVREGTVVVHAPLRSSQAAIDAIVQKRADWIARNLMRQRAELALRNRFALHYGSSVLFLGEEKRLIPAAVPHTQLRGGEIALPEGLDSEGIRQGLIRFYKEQARVILAEKLTRFAPLVGVAVPALRITSAKGRWGSCSGSAVNFTFRLMMAPEDAVDYVVIHELCHKKEMNHQLQFWNLVKEAVPEYPVAAAKLLALQKRLQCENWE